MISQPAPDQSLGFAHRHLLRIEGLSADEISFLLDLSDSYVEVNRREEKNSALISEFERSAVRL